MRIREQQAENDLISTKFIGFISYASAADIESIINSKANQIDHAFMIFHDKDEAENHHHIVFGLKGSRKIGEIRGWFSKCVDEEGKEVNTWAEPVLSCSGIADYLTHSTERAKGKHQYSEFDIKVILGDLAQYKLLKTNSEIKAGALAKAASKADECESLIQDIIDHVPSREMARRYGRDFMKNRKSYLEFASIVLMEETGDFEAAFKLTTDGFDYVLHQAQKQSYIDGVRDGLMQAYEAVVDQENGYASQFKHVIATTINNLPKKKE